MDIESIKRKRDSARKAAARIRQEAENRSFDFVQRNRVDRIKQQADLLDFIADGQEEKLKRIRSTLLRSLELVDSSIENLTSALPSSPSVSYQIRKLQKAKAILNRLISKC